MFKNVVFVLNSNDYSQKQFRTILKLISKKFQTPKKVGLGAVL